MSKPMSTIPEGFTFDDGSMRNDNALKRLIESKIKPLEWRHIPQANHTYAKGLFGAFGYKICFGLAYFCNDSERENILIIPEENEDLKQACDRWHKNMVLSLFNL